MIASISFRNQTEIEKCGSLAASKKSQILLILDPEAMPALSAAFLAFHTTTSRDR
jgi:hypothetical protein